MHLFSLVFAGLGASVVLAAAAPQTHLAISVYPKGKGTALVQRYRLGCDPARGTVPNPARACRILARLPHPFAPVLRGSICADITLGPQEAVVSGVLPGGPVAAHLDLRGSCEIERWRRVRAVVPGFPG
jgi:hypothetical protein